MINNSLSYFVKTNIDPERLALIIDKILEKNIKENYDSESETSEIFDFPFILKEYTINFNK